VRLVRWNGERWWTDDRPVWKRVLGWLVWIGGWHAHRQGNWTLRERLSGEMLAPVSLLGHRVTYFSWGIQCRMKGGYWVAVWRLGKRIYWSPDGTPSNATVWLYGSPPELVQAGAEDPVQPTRSAEESG
jgi:hypothetical protein